MYHFGNFHTHINLQGSLIAFWGSFCTFMNPYLYSATLHHVISVHGLLKSQSRSIQTERAWNNKKWRQRKVKLAQEVCEVWLVVSHKKLFMVYFTLLLHAVFKYNFHLDFEMVGQFERQVKKALFATERILNLASTRRGVVLS